MIETLQMKGSEHPDPKIRDGSNRLLLEAGYEVDGYEKKRKGLRVTWKSLVLFVIGATLLSALMQWTEQFDEILQEAKHYATSLPEVSQLVGLEETVHVSRSVSFSGDGRQPPYKEYRLVVEGKKGSAVVTIRATKSASGEQWTYERRSLP